MKILWFVNIPLTGYLRSRGVSPRNIGGWMDSLLEALREYSPSVGVSIAFEDERNTDVTIDGVRYFAMQRNDVNKQAQRIVEIVNPDIIHIHGSDGLGLRLPEAIFKSYKTVLSIQGIINGCAQHYMGGLTSSILKRHRNVVRAILGYRSTLAEAEFWRTARSIEEKRLFNRVKACLGRTEWDRSWTTYLSPSTRYYHVGEILRDSFYRGRRDESQIVPHSIYCSASLSYPLKGGHWLLRAVASLKRKYPDIILSIANAARVTERMSFRHSVGKNEYYRYLTALIDELDLRKNIRMLPSIDAETVREELCKAEVFCLPSMIENSPNSLAEAMFTGVPCVATDVGGVSSMIRDGKEGILVPSGDPAVLVASIDKLFTHRDLALQYADAAYAASCRRHDPRAVVDDLVKAYKNIAKE